MAPCQKVQPLLGAAHTTGLGEQRSPMTLITREDLIILLGREALYPTPMDDPGSLGTEVDALLMDLMQDVALAAETAAGAGWVPIHATTLLGRRQVATAIAPMLHQLQHGDPDSAPYSAAVQALCAMGPEALEPTLAQWTHPPAPFSDYAYILAHCQAQDERVLSRFLTGLALPGEAAYYANLLGLYGDDRALPALTAHFDAEAERPTAAEDRLHTLRELREAMELLGGAPRIDQALRMASLEGELARANAAAQETEEAEAPPPRQRSRVKRGRNDPCWCGSGKKYKKCHAGADGPQLYA